MIAVSHGIKKIYRVDDKLIGLVGDYEESKAIVNRIMNEESFDDVIDTCVVIIAEYVEKKLRVVSYDKATTLFMYGQVVEALVPFDSKISKEAAEEMLTGITQVSSINLRQRYQKAVNDCIASNAHSVDTNCQFEWIRNDSDGSKDTEGS